MAATAWEPRPIVTTSTVAAIPFLDRHPHPPPPRRRRRRRGLRVQAGTRNQPIGAAQVMIYRHLRIAIDRASWAVKAFSSLSPYLIMI